MFIEPNTHLIRGNIPSLLSAIVMTQNTVITGKVTTINNRITKGMKKAMITGIDHPTNLDM
jgi:ABC-type antimicrobial peptide transport system permease subunit